ncbi:MAG: hypothetical protein JXQ96_21330 [Cyclobacteriaceae bacterium]
MLLISLTCFRAVGQMQTESISTNDSFEKSISKQIIDLDAQLIAACIAYKRNISNNLYLGLEAGAGYGLSLWLVSKHYTKSALFGEIYHYGLLMNYRLTESTQLELGLGRALYLSFPEIDDSEVINYAKLKFFTGHKEVQIGICVTFRKNGDSIPTYVSLPILRFPLNR